MNTATSAATPQPTIISAHRQPLNQQALGALPEMVKQPKAEGYWAQDRWARTDSIFEQFEHRSEKPQSNAGRKRKTVDFSRFPPGIREEVKAFFAWQVQTYRLRVSSLFAYGARLHSIAEFLAERYPHVSSLAEFSPEFSDEQLMSEFVAFLATHRDKDSSVLKETSLPRADTKKRTVFRSLVRFIGRWSDRRPEVEKDRWDLRNFPGVRIPVTASTYFISFTSIPLAFRPLVKRYLQMRVSMGRSRTQCYTDTRTLTLFLSFIHERRPDWQDLTRLSRSDLEAYLPWFGARYPRDTTTYQNYLRALNYFLAYIQRADYAEAPSTPVVLLILREDLHRSRWHPEDTIRFIPEGVLAQLEQHLEHLQPAEYLPIVILLRASGWRISDMLSLRYDTCLERTGLGWYLHGDIAKTQVLNHRIPITDEVAAIVQSVVEQRRERSTPENNPDHLLFVRYDGRRRGKPPLGLTIACALNRLAVNCQIVTDQGEIFHFGNHAFRHTKAVELINNGMNLLYVQKWLAHYSPEMTLRYARILDETLRQAWIETTKGGLFQLDGVGGMRPVNLEKLASEDPVELAWVRTHLDAVRVPRGLCFKPLKQPCPTQDDPCLSCRNFCTTVEFLPEFEQQIAGTKALIAEGLAQGRVIWVQKNEAKLKRLEPIADALRERRIHDPAGKRAREYVGQEREQFQKSRDGAAMTPAMTPPESSAL